MEWFAHFMLIDKFSVAEISCWEMKNTEWGLLMRILQLKESWNNQRYGLKVDAYAKVENISVGQQQR